MFRSLRRKLFRLIVVSGAGAAANYFFDSERGPQRRAQAKDQANGLLKRTDADAGGPASEPANIFDTPTSSGSVTGALRTDAGAGMPNVADALVTPDVALGGEIDGLIVDPAPGAASRPGSVGGA
jgi:hypothetical protein